MKALKKKKRVAPVQPPHNANVKVDFLKVDIPGTIMEGSKVPIKIKALIGKVWHDINPNEAEITVVGDSIEVKDGNVIATKPGNATLRVKYGNVAEKKDITVHGKIDVEIGAGIIWGMMYSGFPIKLRIRNVFVRFLLAQPLSYKTNGIEIETGLVFFFKNLNLRIGIA
ncbi:MAG: hypothetical protein J7L34_04620, partial [Thermotogaceae bacterium]|nr:hypothetical protein [Thermotogaceae bacterium]